MNELNHQLRKAKIVNVPHYDSANDRFVFDDGRVVANNDPIFSRFKWAWTHQFQYIKSINNLIH